MANETYGVTVEEEGTTVEDPNNIEAYELDWNNSGMSREQYTEYIKNVVDGAMASINDNSSGVSEDGIVSSVAGIFGMPYQFSSIVDPPINESSGTKIGRKFSEKVYSVAPILFLTPGEPVFMEEYDKDAKAKMASMLIDKGDLLGGDTDDSSDFDDGRYYTFTSNFPEYQKYVNVALRALAIFMGIQNIEIPVPGKNNTIPLKDIDIKDFMNTNFTKSFGAQCVVPFFVDASNSISESYSNSTTESIVSQTANGFSSAAREVQFIMGTKDYGGILQSIGSAVTDVASNITSALGDIADVVAENNIISKVSNELTTIVSGGKIVFPEIWSDSDYDRNYEVTIKLRSPDPDPISIFLNVYMPIILLVSMTAPRQIGNRSNSYKSPFLVRATYKSIFNCDLGIISSLSIDRGGDNRWNVMGHPTSADVTVSIKDLYSTMFVSKRMGLLSNTAQMDYLSTLAGLDLNDYEATRMIKLWNYIMADTPRDWASSLHGGFTSTLNRMRANFFSKFSDTRYMA